MKKSRTSSQTLVVALAVAVTLWVSGCNWQGEDHQDNTQDNLRVVFQIPVQQTGDPNSVIAKTPVDVTLAVAFSREMDLCSFTAESFLLSANGSPVPGFISRRITPSYPNGFVTFRPLATLAYDTNYTVTIKAGVRALDGTLLAADYSWNFTTASPPPPGPGRASALAGRLAAPLAASPITCATPAAALQADGKIIAAGHINGANFMESAVARYHAGGGLDTSFSLDGMVATFIGSGHSQALAATVQADDRIVAVGVASNDTDQDFALARYRVDGSVDDTFSGDGRRAVDLGTGDERALAVAVQPDGRILVAGSGNDGAAFILARYDADGSTDTSFGTNGIVSTPAAVNSAASYAMVLRDGRIVLASKARVAATQVTVTRYNADGSAFDSMTLPLTSPQAAATLAAHADGRIALVEHSGVGATARFTVLDYLAYE